MFHQHPNLYIAYLSSPPEPSNRTRGQFRHLPLYRFLWLLWSKSDSKVNRKRTLDHCHTGTALSSTAWRSGYRSLKEARFCYDLEISCWRFRFRSLHINQLQMINCAAKQKYFWVKQHTNWNFFAKLCNTYVSTIAQSRSMKYIR